MLPPNSAAAGETVQFVVVLSGPAEGDEVINVNASVGAFSVIPSTVTPESGNDYVTVTATLSQNSDAQIYVEASTEEATVGTYMVVSRTTKLEN